MKLETYKTIMRAADLAIRTFGNNKNGGPILMVDISAHCEVVTTRFYKNGWKPDSNDYVETFSSIGWEEDNAAEKLKDALDYYEGQIKTWEALNGAE